jgi:hypothetical protein
MSTKYRMPHVSTVEVPRRFVMRLTFDDGAVKEWEFEPGWHEGTVFAPFNDAEFFAQVTVDPVSRTVVWPNGVDLDPPCSTATSSLRVSSSYASGTSTLVP